MNQGRLESHLSADLLAAKRSCLLFGAVAHLADLSYLANALWVGCGSLGALLDDIGDTYLDVEIIDDLLQMLYWSHAVWRLHTAQEEESYLSLSETPMYA